jgi:hypothetical protein
MAEDRLPLASPPGDRLASMWRNNDARLVPSVRAMARSAIQKGSSREMLVEWPEIVTERLTIALNSEVRGVRPGLGERRPPQELAEVA